MFQDYLLFVFFLDPRSKREQRVRFKEIFPFLFINSNYCSPMGQELEGDFTHSARLPQIKPEETPFPAETKQHHSVPKGTSKKLKMELTVHLETLLLKIICLAHCSMKTVFRNTSLTLLVSYFCFMACDCRMKGSPKTRCGGSLAGKMKRVSSPPCSGQASCVKEESRPPWSGNGAHREGF